MNDPRMTQPIVIIRNPTVFLAPVSGEPVKGPAPVTHHRVANGPGWVTLRARRRKAGRRG